MNVRIMISLLLTVLLWAGFASPAVAHKQGRPKVSSSFQSCLPPDIKENDIVVYGGSGRKNITVASTLKRLKARCSAGRLLNARRKEIRFFKKTCWGHPPPNYLELQRAEQRELALLKSTYVVIVIECDPRIP